jgi:hypothetical protein
MSQSRSPIRPRRESEGVVASQGNMAILMEATPVLASILFNLVPFNGIEVGKEH